MFDSILFNYKKSWGAVFILIKYHMVILKSF